MGCNAASLPPMPDLLAEVRRRLHAASDPDRAPGMAAYMKSSMPYLGVTSVPLRAICRQVYDADRLPDRPSWEAAVRTLWDHAAYREERYAAMALASHPYYRGYQDPDTLGLYRHLVVTGAWWDYVDSIASHDVGAILRAFPDEVTTVLRGWAVDDDLWLRRTAIVCQLHSKGRTDVSLLTYALEQNLEDSPHGKEFFIRKAVGWALRQHARLDPDWVRAFVRTHDERLSGLSRREALKHLG